MSLQHNDMTRGCDISCDELPTVATFMSLQIHLHTVLKCLNGKQRLPGQQLNTDTQTQKPVKCGILRGEKN